MFPSDRTHQEIVRQRHADAILRARQEQLASVVAAQRERPPIVRLGRLLTTGLLAPVRPREAHAGRP